MDSAVQTNARRLTSFSNVPLNRRELHRYPLSEHPTRIALRIFFLLLAGAVVNVLVAWGCARWGAHRPGEISIGAAAIAAVPPEAEKYVNDSMFRPKPDANAPPPPPSPITTLNPAGSPMAP